jgi:hypothetical protein
MADDVKTTSDRERKLCRWCGEGHYKPVKFPAVITGQTFLTVDSTKVDVEVQRCDKCNHLEFFMNKPEPSNTQY